MKWDALVPGSPEAQAAVMQRANSRVRTDDAPRLETMETLETVGWWSSSVTLADLDAIEFPPQRFLLPGLLPLGGLVQLAGAPKSGKSLFALGAALAVGCGSVAFGSVRVTEPGEVLYVSLDDQSKARMQRRARSLLDGEPLPSTVRLHVEPIGQGVQAVRNLDAYLTAHPGTRLVVLDTLEHLREDRAPGEGVYRADVRFLARLRWVAERHPGVTLLCLIHTRKGEDDDPIEAVGGTHGVTGGADAVLVLSGKRGAPKRRLDVISRDDEDRCAVFALTPHGLRLTDDDPDDPTLTLSADDAALYRAVSEFPDGVTARELADVLPSLTHTGDRLSRLAKRGLLQKAGRGVYRA